MMPKTPALVSVLIVVVVGAAVVAQRGTTRAGDNDWPMYSRDATGSRFSPLTDIDVGNVSKLTQAWSVQLTTPGGRRGGGPAPAAAATPSAAPGQGRGATPGGRAGGAAARGAGDGDDEAGGSNPQVT